jgi:hypothetical protein
MAMPPLPLPLKQYAQEWERKGPGGLLGAKYVTEPMHAEDDLGFSMTQLESFVEDDLQLTQVE